MLIPHNLSHPFVCRQYNVASDIGESSKTFGERYKEHLKAPTPIFEHQSPTGHITTVGNFKIIGREEHNLARTIQEAIYLRVNNPTLNENVSKYNLQHI